MPLDGTERNCLCNLRATEIDELIDRLNKWPRVQMLLTGVRIYLFAVFPDSSSPLASRK